MVDKAVSAVEKTITTNTDTSFGKVPKGYQGYTLRAAGTWGGTNLTASYAQADGTVVPYNDAAASITADGEISIYSGNGSDIYVTTASGTSASIVVSVTLW